MNPEKTRYERLMLTVMKWEAIVAAALVPIAMLIGDWTGAAGLALSGAFIFVVRRLYAEWVDNRIAKATLAGGN